MKITSLKISLFITLILFSVNGKSQEINGIVKSKTASFYFENFGNENYLFNGEIHSNIIGSKYTLSLKNEEDKLEGQISDKLSKFFIDLHYKDDKIEGEIKRSTNHTKDEWNLNIFDTKLSGKVTHNSMKTVDTYDLDYGSVKIKGTIKKKMNTLVYDLLFGDKLISGSMTLNASTVKHTYNLKAEKLNEDEFVVFLFIETIKLLNERIAEIDDFQGN